MRHSARTIITASLLVFVSLLSPLSVLAESISVSAVVPANETSFSAAVSTDTSGTVGQGKVITYTLFYGSKVNDVPLTLKMSWTRGSLAGNGTAIDVTSYVPGSATNGYGSTPAVVDTVNQTVTWSIDSMNAVDGQQVSFQLKTSDSVTSSTKISWSVTGSLTGPGFTKDAGTVTNTFITYSSSSPTATPTPTSIPTPNPTITPTVTPAPPIYTSTKINSVSIETISDSDAIVSIQLSQPDSVSLLYGTSINALDTTVTDPGVTLTHSIHLTQLSPGTVYFFKAKSANIQTEIYTFTSALVGDVPAPLLPSLVITSNNTILTTPLSNGLSQTNSPALVLLPTKTIYEFTITIPNYKEIKRVEAVLRPSHVLGLTSFISQAEASIDSVDLIQTSPGVFTGKLQTPPSPGDYLLFLRISDTKGNIAEQKISALTVSPPFTIVKQDGTPVEGARVKLWYWDSTKQGYFYLAPTSTTITNPAFSDRHGIIPIVLAQGKYKAEISVLRYGTQTIEFTISQTGSGYPQVVLTSQKFSLINTLSYYATTFHDLFLVQTQSYLGNLSTSRRMLDLVNLITLTSFGILLVLSLSTRIHLSILLLPEYLIYLYKRFFHRDMSLHTLSGTAVDSLTDKLLSNVTVYARDEVTDQIVSHAVTNTKGDFTLAHLTDTTYLLTFVKTGYRPFRLQSVSPILSHKRLNVALSTQAPRTTVKQKVEHLIILLLGLSFEILLFLSLLFSLSIGMEMGWLIVLPYLVLSLINFSTWILHQRYQSVRAH